jgi:iron-sulfur cluster assembly accessory protein
LQTLTGGGCSGMQYESDLEESANADDTIIECGGVSIVVDLPRLSMPQGMTVDFLDSMEANGFGDTGGLSDDQLGFASMYRVVLNFR